MALRPHFQPKSPYGGEAWHPTGAAGIPIATALSFSSKSPYAYDDWARDVARPYTLVAMPSYTPPVIHEDLRCDGDFVWYERPIQKPTIVWDGFSALALYEIAAEAFRAGPGMMRVRDMQAGTWWDDPRDPALLARRPKRDEYLPNPTIDPYEHMRLQRAHRGRLYAWAKSCQQQTSRAGAKQESIHWEAVASMYETCGDFAQRVHSDTIQRAALSEKLWYQDHTKPLIQNSGYTSPVRFMDIEIRQKARDGFRPSAQVIERESQGRVRVLPSLDGQRASSASVVPKVGTPADGSGKTSLWARLFNA